MKDGELNLLCARAEDLCREAQKNGVSSGDFLTLAEQAHLACWQDGSIDKEMLYFFGGYGDAERKAMVFVSSSYRQRMLQKQQKEREKQIDWEKIDWEKDDWWQTEPPSEDASDNEPSFTVGIEEAGIAVLAVSVPKGAQMPGHRDFLGSLLALGLDRRALGDIVAFEGKSYLFVKKSVADYIVQSMDRVGRSPVSVEKTELPIDFAPERAFEEMALSVASLRLDALTAAITGLSREDAKTAVIRATVNRNHLPCTQPETQISVGDVLSVKGFGRYRLFAVTGQTKKGRLKIVLQKYV